MLFLKKKKAFYVDVFTFISSTLENAVWGVFVCGFFVCFGYFFAVLPANDLKNIVVVPGETTICGA